MMNCDKAKDLLNDYVEENLEPSQKIELDQFLETDPECKKLFEQSKLAQNQLNYLPKIKTSENFDLNLREKIIIFNKNGEKRKVFSTKGYSIAFSGVLAIAFLFVFTFMDLGSNNVGPTEIAPATNNIQQQEIIVDNEDAEIENEKNATNSDSLKNEPEKVDNSKIKLTGDQ